MDFLYPNINNKNTDILEIIFFKLTYSHVLFLLLSAILVILIPSNWMVDNSSFLIEKIGKYYIYLSFVPSFIFSFFSTVFSETSSLDLNQVVLFNFSFAFLVLFFICTVNFILTLFKKFKKHEIKFLMIYTLFFFYLDYVILFNLARVANHYNQNTRNIIFIVNLLMVVTHMGWYIMVFRKTNFYLQLKVVYDKHNSLLKKFEYLENEAKKTYSNLILNIFTDFNHILTQDKIVVALNFKKYLDDFINSTKTVYPYKLFRELFDHQRLGDFLNSKNEDYSFEQSLFDINSLTIDTKKRFLIFEIMYSQLLKHISFEDICKYQIKLAEEFEKTVPKRNIKSSMNPDLYKKHELIFQSCGVKNYYQSILNDFVKYENSKEGITLYNSEPVSIYSANCHFNFFNDKLIIFKELEEEMKRIIRCRI